MAIKEMDRRTFVAATGATAAAGMLAQIAPSQAWGLNIEGSDENTADIAAVRTPTIWDGTYDVVVVGSGGGLFGAVRAQELGARVACIEKMPSVGGASAESSIFAVSGSRAQLDAGLPDIRDMMLQSFVARQIPDSPNVATICNVFSNATRVVDWMGDLGFEWEPTTTGGAQGGISGVSPKGAELGGCAERANITVYSFLAEKLQQLGGELMLSTTLTALVQDEDGKICGVQVETVSGDTAYYEATDGVILAAGGMGANRDMLAKYVPSAFARAKCSSSGPQDTGEAIRMGLGVGAAFTGFDSYQSFDGGIDGVPWNYYLYSGDNQLARQAWLSFDLTGKRHQYYTHVSEYGKQARLLNSLPGGMAYRIWDNHYDEYASAIEQECCRRLIVPEMPVVQRCVETDWRIGYKRGLDNGYIKQANTLEELAEMLNLDEEIVLQAVADWNDLVASGKEDPCGIPFEWMHPISDPPFYGCGFGSCLFSTHAGLYTNERMQVISKHGSIIEGLYAAGCTMGGCNGPDSSYGMGLNVNGGVSFAATTAFMAAEHIMGVLPAYEPPEFLANPIG